MERNWTAFQGKRQKDRNMRPTPGMLDRPFLRDWKAQEGELTGDKAGRVGRG